MPDGDQATRYESIDALQKVLAKEIFADTASPKKAAGRALGTLVEIITYYLLKSWGFQDSISIELKIPEYGEHDIRHNVEFSLHPIIKSGACEIKPTILPISRARVQQSFTNWEEFTAGSKITNNQLLSSKHILRNSCTIATSETTRTVAFLDKHSNDTSVVSIVQQHIKPYGIIECKRVGVEEGQKKGPQTIEKAKQGAYVARTVSSLQRVGSAHGSHLGIHELPSGELLTGKYAEMLEEVITSNDNPLLENFVYTLGIVSNHGNWFTSNDHNKELKVLANAYDGLLFLTDTGFSEFIHTFLLDPCPEYTAARDAFIGSYGASKTGNNRFTKVCIDYDTDCILTTYFGSNLQTIESWFNLITDGKGIAHIKCQLQLLRDKNWSEIRI